MDMSVSATGSNALREYRKSAAAGTDTAFTQAAQSLLSAPIGGQSSLPEGQKLSDKVQRAPDDLSLSSSHGAIDIKELNAKISTTQSHLLAAQEYGNSELEYLNSLREHGNSEAEHMKKNMRMLEEFMGKMGRELGVAQGTMAIPNDPFGPEPVRTSSGAIHPLSDRIKDYIRAHEDEWNEFQSSPFPPFPSFEEWQQARG